jgi:hypothetical protein
VGLAKTVTRIGDSKRAVLSSRHFDQIRRTVCCSAGTTGTSGPASSGSGLRHQDTRDSGVVFDIGYKGCGAVFETDIVRPVQLPEIFEAL